MAARANSLMVPGKLSAKLNTFEAREAVREDRLFFVPLWSILSSSQLAQKVMNKHPNRRIGHSVYDQGHGFEEHVGYNALM